MNAVAQNEILSLVADINSFADNAESLINHDKIAFTKRKKDVQDRYQITLSNLETEYKKSCARISNRSKKTISDANAILSEISKMDQHLSSVDKYYVKVKNKKEESLAGTTSSAYSNSIDYFSSLSAIQKDFDRLYKKYSEDILPSILNGLNYLFSTQRKKDYEELIILRNTVSSFVKEIETELPPITDESINELKHKYYAQRDVLSKNQKEELEKIEAAHNQTLDNIAGEIYDSLDNVLPDELVDYFFNLMNTYNADLLRVNSTNYILNTVLDMCFVDYNVDFFVQSPIVASIIKDKCSKILINGAIRLPMNISTLNAPIWMIYNDNQSALSVQRFIHSIMYGFLSSLPVSSLTFSIIDPENRGNSITPFFDARKKLPELFGDRIIINKDEVSAKIDRVNSNIEEILQYRLGTKYNTIYDYAKDNPEYNLHVELLVLWDFPKGFDDRTTAELRNILRNGSKCGIYTIISYLPNEKSSSSNEFEKNIDSIKELTTSILQRGDEFIYNGLSIQYHNMPDKKEFEKFFSKYMLVFEGIKNRGIAFSPMIKRLVDATEGTALDTYIEQVKSIMSVYNQCYGKVPKLEMSYPSSVMLGNVLYPSDIFSDSFGYERMLSEFGKNISCDDESNYIELPLSFELSNSFNLFFNCSEINRQRILEFTHHIIWTFLSFMPVSKVNICVFDGEQRGNSIVPFLDFRKKCPEIFDEKIYTNPDGMYERLKDLNEKIDEFIQEKLSNKFKDILEYNINTPNRAEAITLLLIYDFPFGMDNRSLDQLSSILRNGSKCGVFVIMCHNPTIEYSRYERIDDRLDSLTRYCSMIDYKDGNYVLLPYNLRIKVPSLPKNSEIDDFIREYFDANEKLKSKGISFKDILSNDLFSRSSASSLSIPMGIGDGETVIDMLIGEGSSHHGLIAGATGSGKSTLLHTLIMSSMLHYSPNELHLYLMDFKSGTEFKIYESVKLPHIQLLALDAMQEFGESILENLVKEMEHRGELFKEVEQTKLKGYIQATGKPLPRILVIMDEFQILYNDSTNRKVANNCAELTKRLITEGRAYGIHLFMATQSTKVITDLTLSTGTIEQMRIRVGLKCGENDARYLFTDQHDSKALSMMKGPTGTAVVNYDYTEKENIGFRVAYCDDETQKFYLQMISKKFADVPDTLQIFEGSRTVKLTDHLYKNAIGYTNEIPICIPMGMLIKVAPPFVFTIDKKKKHNLLVCGSSERMTDVIINNYIIGALLNKNVRIYCIDGDLMVGEASSQSLYDVYSASTPRFKLAVDRGDIINFIKEIYHLYQTRKKQKSNEVIFCIIKNLQFLDIVKSMFKGDIIEESDYIEDESVVAEEASSLDPFAALNNMFANRSNSDEISCEERIKKMIEDGSGFGIHFVVTSSDYQTIKETMYYGDNLLTKFPERIIFSLGNADAENLIENVSVAGLRDNTVYFTDGVKNTFQMKPYITPSVSELKKLLD